jgi:hypothetical protein
LLIRAWSLELKISLTFLLAWSKSDVAHFVRTLVSILALR